MIVITLVDIRHCLVTDTQLGRHLSALLAGSQQFLGAVTQLFCYPNTGTTVRLTTHRCRTDPKKFGQFVRECLRSGQSHLLNQSKNFILGLFLLLCGSQKLFLLTIKKRLALLEFFKFFFDSHSSSTDNGICIRFFNNKF